MYQPNSVLNRSVKYTSIGYNRITTLHSTNNCFTLCYNRSRGGTFINRISKLSLNCTPAYNFTSCNPGSHLHNVHLFRFHRSSPSTCTAHVLACNSLIRHCNRGRTHIFVNSRLIISNPALHSRLHRPNIFTALTLLTNVTISTITSTINSTIGTTATHGHRWIPTHLRVRPRRPTYVHGVRGHNDDKYGAHTGHSGSAKGAEGGSAGVTLRPTGGITT